MAKTIGKLLGQLGALALGTCMGASVNAAYTLTFLQVGPDVVATGSGSINTTALTPFVGLSFGSGLAAGSFVGTSGGAACSYWQNVNVPDPIAPGSTHLSATTGSGHAVGIAYVNQAVCVPFGYVSGTALSSSATWAGSTFADLGLTPGARTYSWGSGPTADSFTIQVGPAAAAAPTSIPTLSQWGMLAMSALLAAAALVAMRRRRPQRGRL